LDALRVAVLLTLVLLSPCSWEEVPVALLLALLLVLVLPLVLVLLPVLALLLVLVRLPTTSVVFSTLLPVALEALEVPLAVLLLQAPRLPRELLRRVLPLPQALERPLVFPPLPMTAPSP
jgi:hypothetical protein